MQTYMKRETRKRDEIEEERTNWRGREKIERKEHEEKIKQAIRSTYARRTKALRLASKNPTKWLREYLLGF